MSLAQARRQRLSDRRIKRGALIRIQSQGVQAMAKHFAGNDHEFQFERWTAGVRIPSRAMHELYLLPFEMAVKDGDVAGLMCVPASQWRMGV